MCSSAEGRDGEGREGDGRPVEFLQMQSGGVGTCARDPGRPATDGHARCAERPFGGGWRPRTYIKSNSAWAASGESAAAAAASGAAGRSEGRCCSGPGSCSPEADATSRATAAHLDFISEADENRKKKAPIFAPMTPPPFLQRRGLFCIGLFVTFAMSDPAGGGGLQIPLRFVHNWPATHGGVGKRIADAEAVPGAVRHELILEKAVLGKLIGVGGSVVNSLQTQTGCGIFVVDKEAPPGLAETQRLVVLVGTLAQCELGTIAVFSALEGGTRPASHAPPSHAPAMAVAPTTRGSCTRLVANWPPPHGGNGKRIAEAEAVPGVVRHEILLDKNCLGKLIGVGGAMLKELQTRTGTQIHVCDKEPPPGYAESQRLIVIIGAEYLIGRAAAEIFAVVESVAYKQGAVRGGAPPAQAAGAVGYGPPPPPAYGAPPPSMPVQLGTAYTPHGTELTRYVSQVI